MLNRDHITFTFLILNLVAIITIVACLNQGPFYDIAILIVNTNIYLALYGYRNHTENIIWGSVLMGVLLYVITHNLA